MNFSEKLMKLRKENLLSQEELGEKLNVTRQTVSKWELGQTTPDMEKLVEMSKLFGVSLDELTSDSELNNNNSVNEKNSSTRTVIIIVILVLILLGSFALMTGKIIGNGVGLFKNIFDRQKDVFDRHQTISNQIQESFYSIQNQVSEEIDNETKSGSNDIFNSAQETINSYQNESNKKSFNRTFEIRGGTKGGASVQWLIDDVIQNNQTNERQVTVKYYDQALTTPADLRALKRNFDNAFDKFEVYFEYGEDGYIYEAIIEKI